MDTYSFKKYVNIYSCTELTITILKYLRAKTVSTLPVIYQFYRYDMVGNAYQKAEGL